MKRFFTLFVITIVVVLANTLVHAQSVVSPVSVPKSTVSKSDVANNVVMLSLDLTKTGNAIKLNWQTASEKNNNYFEIQRSTDGVQFEVIALMFAKEDAEKGAAYRYTDQQFTKLNAGNIYYRLRIIDISGKSVMLDPKKIDLTEAPIPQ
jgi:hypothetical protein